MAPYNLTVDDISPLISYEGNWESLTMNHPGDEAAVQSFHDNTLHALNSDGSATLQFAGGAISIWGPIRPDSSRYKVRLDGDDVNTVGFGTTSNESALLYSVSGLSPGLPHILQIINVPLDNPQRPWLRIDKFVVESGTDGDDNVKVVTIHDSDPSINYTPSRRSWSSEIEDQSAYRGGTLHASDKKGARLGFTTGGDSVEIYGGQNGNFSRFAVTVDGIQRNFTPNVFEFQAPVLLFQTEFLQRSDQHTIQVEVLEAKRFEFEFVRIVRYRESSLFTADTSTSLVNKANTGVQTPLLSGPSNALTLSGPAIAGIILGCLAVLALAGSALLLCRRKMRRRQLPASAALVTRLGVFPPQKNTPIYEEFSSVYRSHSNGTGEQSTPRCMDLLAGRPEPASGERSKYEPYLLMYKTGAVRSAYEATLRPEDSASFHVRSPPASEVGSQTQSDYVTHFTPTVSAALPPLSEK